MSVVPEPGSFSIDLQELLDTTARIRGYKEFLSDHVDELQRRASALQGTWSGAAAEAFADSCVTCLTSLADVKAALQVIEDLTEAAHENYSGAITTNLRMLGR